MRTILNLKDTNRTLFKPLKVLHYARSASLVQTTGYKYWPMREFNADIIRGVNELRLLHMARYLQKIS